MIEFSRDGKVVYFYDQFEGLWTASKSDVVEAAQHLLPMGEKLLGDLIGLLVEQTEGISDEVKERGRAVSEKATPLENLVVYAAVKNAVEWKERHD